MVTLEAKFKCETCGTEVFQQIRIGPNFFLGADQLPTGWVVFTEQYALRSWCPLHAMNSKPL
jgi:hypothetical protein